MLVLIIIAVTKADVDPCGLSLNQLASIYEHEKLTVRDVSNTVNANNLTYPVWPLTFNCTLQKINPFNHNIQWTKLYYDWRTLGMKFSFFDYYQDVKGNWGPEYCRILFVNTTIYFIKPKIRSCKIRG